jgi:hypothetical protein
MDYYAGIDGSLELSSVCILDATGQLVREAKVASEPEALATFLASLNLPLTRVGLETGPLSQWLHAGLGQAGFEVVLLETRHVKAALSAMIVKTDRRDARGIAQLLRMGWFRPVHCKSPPAQEVRALLMARKQLQAKMRDIELSLRGLLRGFGLKIGEISKGQFATRARTLTAGHAMLETIAEAMLRAREALQSKRQADHIWRSMMRWLIFTDIKATSFRCQFLCLRLCLRIEVSMSWRRFPSSGGWTRAGAPALLNSGQDGSDRGDPEAWRQCVGHRAPGRDFASATVRLAPQGDAGWCRPIRCS